MQTITLRVLLCSIALQLFASAALSHEPTVNIQVTRSDSRNGFNVYFRNDSSSRVHLDTTIPRAAAELQIERDGSWVTIAAKTGDVNHTYTLVTPGSSLQLFIPPTPRVLYTECQRVVEAKRILAEYRRSRGEAAASPEECVAPDPSELDGPLRLRAEYYNESWPADRVRQPKIVYSDIFDLRDSPHN